MAEERDVAEQAGGAVDAGPGTADDVRHRVVSPFTLTVDTIGRFLNCELAGHPVYDGLELQWFDDQVHGTGMLAFLSRRDDRTVDYYVCPELRLDRAGYQIGGGTRGWWVTDFEVAVLRVDRSGVVADVRWRDVDGRLVEVSVDDRAAGARCSGDVLAPVSAGIDEPTSMLFVLMHGFDLVRRGGEAPSIRIDGVEVPTGSLPLRSLHRRHLVKAAGPLATAQLNPDRTGALRAVDVEQPGDVLLDPAGGGIRGLRASNGVTTAELRLDPPFPSLDALTASSRRTGSWSLRVDGATLAGGSWRARRRGGRATVGMDVTAGWRPAHGLPALLRVVTTVVRTFRRWPTTYRWTATVELGDQATIDSAWERTDAGRGRTYRRLTRS